ncbi:glycoside hydrolase family 16 protein [Hymenobacter taeanensis]|uniref:Glycoside hydrolase family 16 protein n=1 Tax=Hymenobacter taeanensis TaxID=2735321 RepID=A0A6M6BLL9_9BACT|nr:MULTISPECIES: glycoside hydrolase family 16 protein [Hymenobacter]QJX48879.1 glycoside hydrolase family 16 protein [Hymenobacter taeanensis]UOQ81608.1 glycoside hydrolase family 16 protein [Hymenobacter sp. 5414T-23]
MRKTFTGISLRQKAGASYLLALSLLACTETKPQVIPAPAPALVNSEAREPNQYTELKWSDDFDGSALDQTKWVYEQGASGWGNQELQNYTNSPENVFTESGNLVIRAKQQTPGTNSYTSGRIITKGKQSFQFGRLDVRAKVPKGKGVWPAIWMLGSDIDQNNWPVCGEIDIMELRGSKPREMLSTMHYGTGSADHRYTGTTERLAYDLSDDFHVFSVVRSQNLMRFYLDGREYYRFSNSDASPYPFNNPFFVILNLAIGGNFDGNPDATTTFPQQMQVDYVRFYQYK